MILYFNVDNNLIQEIDSVFAGFSRGTSGIPPRSKDVTSVFIDWIPTKKAVNQIKASNLLSQTEILEKYVKTVPIVIFDRYRAITTEEYNWLKKFNVTFFEPSLVTRKGFKYLPNWIKIKELNDIKLNERKREINIGYIGSLLDKQKSFDEYYIKKKINNPDIEISYYSKDIDTNKQSEYESLGVNCKQDLQFTDMEFTIIIGNVNDYKNGHLDQYFVKALENNCIPLIPKENRYYVSLSFGVNELTWYISMYDKVYFGLIHDIYCNIQKYYPEMDIKYTANTIREYLSET